MQENFGQSTRELEIVSILVTGYTYEETAELLGLTQEVGGGLSRFLGNIFKKLGVSTIEELARFAAEYKRLSEGKDEDNPNT